MVFQYPDLYQETCRLPTIMPEASQFCVFIFNNSNVLYNLIQVITQLLGQMDVNSDRVSEFNAQQGNYIEDMKKVLDEFRIDNFNVA